MTAVLLAAAAGIAGLAAQEPVGWWPLAFLQPALLLGAVARAPDRAGRLGLLGGLVTFVPMLTWLVLPAGTLAWLLLSVITAGWTALFAVLVRPWHRHPVLWVVAPVAWVGGEFVRMHHPFSGFGWATIDLAHASGSWLLPLARVTGGHGLALVTLVVATGLYRFGLAAGDARAGSVEVDWTAPGAAGQRPLLVVAATLAIATLAQVQPPATDGTVGVLVAQGNPFVTSTLSAGDEDLAIARNLAEQTRLGLADARADGTSVDLVVWPEYGVDQDIARDRSAALASIVFASADSIAAAGAELFAGLRRSSSTTGDPEFFRNTITLVPPGLATGDPALDATLDAAPQYLKRRPVPFGEYVPLRHLLGGFPPLAAQVPRDAEAGRATTIGLADGTRVAVLVCFETLFADLTRSNLRATPDGDGAGLVVAATNDASYGISGEAAQHVAQSRMRAVESGRWVVHASLNGTSAIIDADGRVLEETRLFTVDRLRHDVPVATGPTPFLRSGDVAGNASGLGLVVLVLVRVVHRRREPAAA